MACLLRSCEEHHIASHLAIATKHAFNNGENFKKTIPSNMRVWVTEMGLYPPGSLDGTWLHALFFVAMDFQLPAALVTRLETALDIGVFTCHGNGL